MKNSLLKTFTLAGALFAVPLCNAIPIAVTQSLDIWVLRGETQSISFTGLTGAASDAVLGLTARGDLNNVGEFVSVYGEGDFFLGDLFNSESAIPETGSLAISLGSLETWLADGTLDFVIGIALGNGSEKAWLLSATLSYMGVDEVVIGDEVPTNAVPDAGSTVALLGFGLFAIPFFARRKSGQTA